MSELALPRWVHVLHPWGWTLLFLAALNVFPSIDLGVSGAFYGAGGAWGLRDTVLGDFVRHIVPRLVIGSVVLYAALWLIGLARKRAIVGITAARLAYLVTTLLVGPGLIVETLLKEHWGRARPDEIVEFGGMAHYTSPLMFSDGCSHNCSFVSGHAAIAFWATAYAFLAPQPYRVRAFFAALAFGAAVGLVRMVQGAHFISDVAYAGAIVVGVNAIAYRLMSERLV